MMIRTFVSRTIIAFLLLLSGASLQAQVRSSTVQTIDGTKYYMHKIEKSQSLYGISKLYNVSIDELIRINPELKAGAKINQIIKVPFRSDKPAVMSATIAPAPPPIDTMKYCTYKVSKGETSYSIMKKFKIPEKEFNTYNPTAPQGLKENQIVIIGEREKKKTNPLKEIGKIFSPKEKDEPLFTDSSLFIPQVKEKKTSYNLALILPFRVNQTLQIDNNDLIRSNSAFPSIPALSVDFYLGFQHAVDSLKAPDFAINLLPYDIDDKDTAKLNQLWRNPDFKNLDLIFGPLYLNGFKTISQKAKEQGIPIVSPLTQQNKILYNNIYISKTNPSQFTLLESLADYCIDSLVNNGTRIILMTLHDKDKKEAAFVSAFRKYYNNRLLALGRSMQDSLINAKGIDGLKSHYKPNIRHVVVSLSNNQVFVTDFTTQLSIINSRGDITLCGWQTITEMGNIDQEYLNQLHYTFPHQHNITNESAYSRLIEKYRSQQETVPGEYYFMGFEIAHYYLKQLKEQGPDFVHRLDSLPFEGNYMRFKFARPDNQTGFDNRGLYIFKYNDYQIIKTGWK